MIDESPIYRMLLFDNGSPVAPLPTLDATAAHLHRIGLFERPPSPVRVLAIERSAFRKLRRNPAVRALAEEMGVRT